MGELDANNGKQANFDSRARDDRSRPRGGLPSRPCSIVNELTIAGMQRCGTDSHNGRSGTCAAPRGPPTIQIKACAETGGSPSAHPALRRWRGIKPVRASFRRTLIRGQPNDDRPQSSKSEASNPAMMLATHSRRNEVILNSFFRCCAQTISRRTRRSRCSCLA